MCVYLFFKLNLKTDLVFGDLQQGTKFSMYFPIWSTGLSGYLDQCSGLNEMLCIARAVDALELLLAGAVRASVTGSCCCTRNEKYRKTRQRSYWGWNSGKPSSTRVVLMLFLPRWCRKLVAWLMQKAWGGIHAFLGKIMFYCDCNKDSVFNFFSSRVPKSRQIHLAWAKILFTFDPEVTRIGKVVCLQVARLFT